MNIRHALFLITLSCGLTTATSALQIDYTGNWQTYWRTGSAVLTLEQDGDQVQGYYQPDNGSIAGSIEDGVLRGTWQQPG